MSSEATVGLNALGGDLQEGCRKLTYVLYIVR
jgi:hypothetical protein